MSHLKPCLFNCVVYSAAKERLDYCLEFMRQLALYFPCRLFVIHRLEDKESYYAQNRQLPYGDGAQFYDTLFVEVSKDQLNRVAFALFPFLDPELPIVLFWDCDPTEEKAVLPDIAPYASRLIFDSETIEPLSAFARRLLDASHEEKACLDLNWARLAGWRHLLAKVFDTKERLEQLHAASYIRILYNARENRFFHHSQTQSLYLQAWLAAKMGWHYEAMQHTPEGIKCFYHCEGNILEIHIEPLYVEDKAPGSVLYMEIKSLRGTEVMIDSRQLSGLARVKSECDASCTLPYSLPLPGSKLNHRFFQQLLYQEVGDDYDKMLQVLAGMEK